MGGPGPHTTVRTRPPRRRVAHHVSASAAVARRTAVLHQRSYRADAGMAVADRWGWLPEAAVRRQAARTTTATAGSRGGHTRSRGFVGGVLFGWFGPSWYDHWRYVYPTTLGWLLFITIVAVWGL